MRIVEVLIIIARIVGISFSTSLLSIPISSLSYLFERQRSFLTGAVQSKDTNILRYGCSGRTFIGLLGILRCSYIIVRLFHSRALLSVVIHDNQLRAEPYHYQQNVLDAIILLLDHITVQPPHHHSTIS